MVDTVLQTKDMNVWAELETVKYMLEHSGDLDILGQDFEEDLVHFSKALYVLLNSVDTDILNYTEELRGRVNSKTWNYKVDREDCIEVIEDIISEKE